MAIIAYDKTCKDKISKNFKASEFKCKCSGHCTKTLIDENLIAYAQRIRDHFDAPVVINSAYRCPTHNKSVGGVTKSLHVEGRAADIKINGVSPAEIARYAELIGIKGIGLYETSKDGYFVHIDTRETKSFWYGQKQEKRETFISTKEQLLNKVAEMSKSFEELSNIISTL